MNTVFSRVIAGELPARFVWSDEHAVAFLSINPVGPGHTLVVSRLEVDQWTDAPPGLVAHLTTVAHAVGAAIGAVWRPPRVGLMVAGFEVPHLHLHVFPAANMAPFSFGGAAATVDPAEQDRHAAALRAALRAAGHRAFVPS
jgi:diadenosine tetraphosphate (Ap4A) HIT family hydrolase